MRSSAQVPSKARQFTNPQVAVLATREYLHATFVGWSTPMPCEEQNRGVQVDVGVSERRMATVKLADAVVKQNRPNQAPVKNPQRGVGIRSPSRLLPTGLDQPTNAPRRVVAPAAVSPPSCTTWHKGPTMVAGVQATCILLEPRRNSEADALIGPAVKLLHHVELAKPSLRPKMGSELSRVKQEDSAACSSFVEVPGIDLTKLEQQVGLGGNSVAHIPSEQGGGFYLRSNRAGGAGCLEVAVPSEVCEACIEVESPPCPTQKEPPRHVEGNDLPTLVTTRRGRKFLAMQRGGISITSGVVGTSLAASAAGNHRVAGVEVLDSPQIVGDEVLSVQLDIPEAAPMNLIGVGAEEVVTQLGDPQMSGDVPVVAKVNDSSNAQVGLELSSEEFESKKLNRNKVAVGEAGVHHQTRQVYILLPLVPRSQIYQAV
jgi:hypothetical protein